MKRAIIPAAIALALTACGRDAPVATSLSDDAAVATVAEPASAPMRRKAASAVQRFAEALEGELQRAMADGGPMRAVDVCHRRAPAIADELSAQTGFRLARVSLRYRNAERGEPTAWQRDVLQAFEQQLDAGTPVTDLVYSAASDGEFRFMRAIPTGTLCLTCHGTALAPALAAKINALYPEDLATGYRAGELRGAFVASQPLAAKRR